MNLFPHILFELGQAIPNGYELLNLEKDGSAIGKYECISKRMDLNEFVDSIPYLKTKPVFTETIFIQMEPDPEFKAIKEIGVTLNGLGITWGIIAQGQSLSKYAIKELHTLGMESLFINLDGLIDTHKSFNRDCNSFIDDVLIISQAAKYKDLNFTVLTNVNAININELNDVQHLLESLHVSKWLLNYRLMINRMDTDGLKRFVSFVEQKISNSSLSTSVVYNASSNLADAIPLPITKNVGNQNIVIKPF